MKAERRFFGNSPRLVILGAILCSILVTEDVLAQCSFGAADCQTSMPANTSATLFNVTWTHNSGPACPIAGNTSYAGNLKASVLGNNTTLTISATFTVTGDFQMTNSGSSTTLIIPAGVTFTVNGNLGDCTNNNVNFQVDGTLIVVGTIYGKNSNAFSGAGSITAGGLNFSGGTGASCPTPCNISWDVGTCTSAGTFCTLPIKLTLFDAQVRANGVQLRWVTESEEYVDFLTLEKSSNGNEFYGVADFPSQGDTRQQHSYSFLDEKPVIGKSYYRIRETTLDGRVTFYRIISVEYNGGRLLDIYPVPVSDNVINLRTNYQMVGDSHVVITDVTGSVIQDVVIRGKAPLRLPLKLEPGVYLLTFTNEDFRTVKRFVVH